MNNKTLAAVESFTGGLFASTVISKPGASKYFKGSLVSYFSEVKEKLGVDVSKGVINAEVAKQMALKGKEFFGANICVSFTGNAGPDSMENKPAGLVFVAINEEVFELNLTGSRNEIREKAVEFALEKISKTFPQVLV